MSAPAERDPFSTIDPALARGQGQAIRRASERAEAVRVGAALDAFAAGLAPSTVAYMESCIRCGRCAEACEFYLATREAKYTPIWKIEPFRRHYARTAGAFAWLYRAIGVKQSEQVRLADLVPWRELIFDACTLCGRCTVVCPMAIDIAALIDRARGAMLEAGLGPEKHSLSAQDGASSGGSSSGVERKEAGVDPL